MKMRLRLGLFLVAVSLVSASLWSGTAEAVICPQNQCRTSADCTAVCGSYGGACVAGSPYIGGACGNYMSCHCF